MEIHRQRIANNQCTRCGKTHVDNWTKKKCEICSKKESNYRKKTRDKRRDKERTYRIKNWSRRCCYLSKSSDLRKDREVGGDYITPKRLKTLRALQLNQCFYCETPMNTENRKRSDGLTIERLDNSRPHSEDNIVLCCSSCNCHKISNKQNISLANAYRSILSRLEESAHWETMIKALKI